MHGTMMKKLLCAGAIALAALAPLAQAEEKKTFNLAWTIYVGWMPWKYADESGIMKKWADKYGIEVNISQINDYVESINQYSAGQFDGVVATSMDALSIPAAGGVDTTALIVGTFAERIKFKAVLLFSALWFTLSYIPMAHIVWGGGYLGAMGAIDFAGGTVVHINAGVAGLVGAYFVGKRIGYGQTALKPHNVPFTYIGAMLLWVGWFGFNAGSAAAADTVASLAFLNTVLATAAAVLGWTLTEAITKGKPSALGAASGAVAGLVGITPACGTVGPLGAIVIGLVAGVVCVWGVTGLKRLLKVDDTADVFGVHGVGGIVGAILTGVFSAQSLGGTKADLDIGHQVWVQVVSVGLTVVWSAVVTAAILLLVKVVVGLRVTEEAERTGLDVTSHGESAYEA